MELRQLQFFIAIARVGGFRRAADQLNVSQATLSQQIKLLEHELGVPLFERSRRRVALTPAGVAFAPATSSRTCAWRARKPSSSPKPSTAT